VLLLLLLLVVLLLLVQLRVRRRVVCVRAQVWGFGGAAPTLRLATVLQQGATQQQWAVAQQRRVHHQASDAQLSGAQHHRSFDRANR
jgi:hypothetical protein